jgi:colanic acid/amylovoran biosynthesis protein
VIGPEDDNDRLVQRRIAAMMRHGERATVLDVNFSPKEMVSRISELDFVLATRFHSAIFTMLANVPVVAIAYEHKTTGIMALLGMGQWVIPIEQVNEAHIVSLCIAIMEQRDAVEQHLAQAVGAMCQRAHSSVEPYLAAPVPNQGLVASG